MKKISAVLIVHLLFLGVFFTACSFPKAQETDGVWSCTLHISEQGGKRDDVVFGEAYDARDGPPADTYDMVKPPTPLVPYVRAWFDDNLPSPYNLLWKDYRCYPDASKTWNLTVQWIPSDYSTSTTVTIAWDLTETSASGYSSMNLHTYSGTFLVNMLMQDSYTFNCPANIPQTFQILCTRANNPPGPPNVPSGTTTGYHGTSYPYSTSSVDPDGDELYYQFNWGDTILSSWLGPYPSGEMVQTSYSWDAPGIYQVTAHAKDIHGAQSNWSSVLIVEMMNRPPSQPTNPIPHNGATNVQIDPVLSWTGDDPDGDFLTFDVYFGTKDPPSKSVDNQSSLSFNPGILLHQTTYYWKIVSWDSFGGHSGSPVWSFTTKAFDSGQPAPPNGDTNQTNIPPVADASLSEQTGFVGTFVIFNGSQSYDSDGYLTKWFWDFGDGTNGNGEITTHAYQESGLYTVTLTVTDNKGTTADDTITVQIMTANQPPAKPVITGTRTGTKNTLYTYMIYSTDPENDFLQYRVTWGDGTSSESEFLPNGIVYSFSHSWNASGKYVIAVRATDNTTLSEETTFEVFIDVLFIRLLGFLYDASNDGLYDSFYSNTTGRTTSTHQLENGSYLLDTDGDGTWNYLFDPSTGSLTVMITGVTTIDNPWFFIIIIAVAIVLIAGIVYLYKKNYF